MKKTVNAKIVWLLVLLTAIIFASTTFGTFEPFEGLMPDGVMPPRLPGASLMPGVGPQGFRNR